MTNLEAEKYEKKNSFTRLVLGSDPGLFNAVLRKSLGKSQTRLLLFCPFVAHRDGDDLFFQSLFGTQVSAQREIRKVRDILFLYAGGFPLS